jgi:hypothetical protein
VPLHETVLVEHLTARPPPRQRLVVRYAMHCIEAHYARRLSTRGAGGGCRAGCATTHDVYQG